MQEACQKSKYLICKTISIKACNRLTETVKPVDSPNLAVVKITDKNQHSKSGRKPVKTRLSGAANCDSLPRFFVDLDTVFTTHDVNKSVAEMRPGSQNRGLCDLFHRPKKSDYLSRLPMNWVASRRVVDTRIMMVEIAAMVGSM